MAEPIPRRIFLYWEQGFHNAPPVVSLAVNSWRSMNPGFDIVLLDKENVVEWFDGANEIRNWDSLRVSHQSDLLRLALLSKYGGYWSDATLVCTKPLNRWVPPRPKRGFVMLDTVKGKNRFTQTFFLGSRPGSFFARAWFKELKRVMESRASAMTPPTQKRWRKRRPLLWANPAATSIWSLVTWTRITGYPYLVAHYVANRLILTHLQGLLTYKEQPRVLAGEALHLQDHPEGNEILRELLSSDAYPLWKLTWRTSVNPEFWAEVMSDVQKQLNLKK